jgi:hypothetical protein
MLSIATSIQESSMPKGTQRSNREKKKAKQPKKPKAVANPFPSTQAPIPIPVTGTKP